MLRPICIAATLAASMTTAWAQDAPGLDPRAAGALSTMTGVAGEYCRRGSERACAFDEKVRRATTVLVAAQQACARGSRRGCEAVERGVAEVSVVYRQFLDEGGALARPTPGTDGAATSDPR